jgi:hypothetical protein
VYTIRKLKPDRSFGMILVPFAVLVVCAFAGTFFGIAAAYLVGGVVFVVFAAYSLLTYGRTRNTGFIVVALFQASAGLMAFTAPLSFGEPPSGVALFFAVCMAFFAVWTLFLAFNKRIKWRGREVLELAAAGVDQVGDGYTTRPLPVGRIESDRRQVVEFAEFARRHLIAATYVASDRVAFVPVPEGREPAFILGLRGDYVAETWVSVDFEGNVSANISRRDYLEFRDALSFDKLCESLGNLFVEFLDLHRRGEGVRIIDRLDAVGLPYFT